MLCSLISSMLASVRSAFTVASLLEASSSFHSLGMPAFLAPGMERLESAGPGAVGKDYVWDSVPSTVCKQWLINCSTIYSTS